MGLFSNIFLLAAPVSGLLMNAGIAPYAAKSGNGCDELAGTCKQNYENCLALQPQGWKAVAPKESGTCCSVCMPPQALIDKLGQKESTLDYETGKGAHFEAPEVCKVPMPIYCPVLSCGPDEVEMGPQEENNCCSVCVKN